MVTEIDTVVTCKRIMKKSNMLFEFLPHFFEDDDIIVFINRVECLDKTRFIKLVDRKSHKKSTHKKKCLDV